VAEIKVGDRVRHRASGEVGVVIDVFVGCTNPTHLFVLHCLNRPNECNKQVLKYKVSAGFGKDFEYGEGVVEPLEDGHEAKKA
jgi:hypothetical protein